MYAWNGIAWVALPSSVAASIANVPAGRIGSTTVQGAINELDTEKVNNSDLLMAIGNINSPLLDMPLKNSLAMKSGAGSATFTRASTATYIDRYGVLNTAAVDTPRFEKEGYLNEGSSTNLFTYSEQFDNAAWGKSNATISANTTATLDPYGTNLADKLVEDSTTNIHAIYQAITVTSSTLTFSCFVKAAESTKFRLNSYESTTPKVPVVADFDLLAITATVGNASTTSATITPLANGWFRVSATTTSAALVSTSFSLQATRLGTGTYMGDGVSGLYIFGAQLEASPFASSYIPTVASTVTRAKDVLSISYLNNTAGINNRFSEETVMFDIVRMPQTVITFPFTVAYNETSYRVYAGIHGIIAQYGSDSVSGTQLTSNTSPYIKYRTALSHDTSGVTKSYMDGVLTQTGTSGTANSGGTIVALYIGSNGGSDQCNAHYSNFRVFDRALTAYEVALA
jgi:hypothetical protein